MGLMDKLKNLFTDEEIVEVTKDIEIPKEEEHKLPTFMREKIEKQEQEKKVLEVKPQPEMTLQREKNVVVESENTMSRSSANFKFPVSFDEDEISTPVNASRNIIAQEKRMASLQSKTAYNPKIERKPKKFQASPIISPVYGILDKNYKKEEPKVKDETNYEIPRDTKRALTFEDVRKKAYGTLADDIKDNILCDDCEVLKTVNEIKKENAELKENLLADLYDERKKSDASMSLEEAEDNYYDFGVSYERPSVNEVVPKKVQATIENTTKMKIVSFDEIEPSAEKIEMKESPKEVKNNDNLELTDDLFNLIDSMYEERKD